ERLMKGVEESKKASARLDAFQKEKQAELDTKQSELKRMEVKLGARAEGRAEYEKARIELAARYSAYQKALKDKEQSEEERVRGAARALVQEAMAAARGAIFIDGPAADSPLSPKCEVSAWFVDLARKSTRPEDLVRACPA